MLFVVPGSRVRAWWWVCAGRANDAYTLATIGSASHMAPAPAPRQLRHGAAGRALAFAVGPVRCRVGPQLYRSYAVRVVPRFREKASAMVHAVSLGQACNAEAPTTLHGHLHLAPDLHNLRTPASHVGSAFVVLGSRRDGGATLWRFRLGFAALM